MEQRTLGRSSLVVSELALGTMTFGVETAEDEAHRQLERFVEAGGTFIDTADVYGAGASEAIIGRWLARAGDTESLVLTTKGRFPMGPGPMDRGAGRRHLTRALDDSLRRLGVESIDLYQVHGWDPAAPLEETLTTLDGFVRSGKVRHVGVSNYTGWQLQRAIRLGEALGTEPIISLQAQYNLLAREIELEVLPQCLEEGLGLLPWSPLGGGWLTGKYRSDQRPTGATRLGEDPNRGVEAYDRRNTPRTWTTLEAVEQVAADRGCSLAQASLAWLLRRPAVSSVILGARTVEQLDDNLGAVDVDLSAEEVDALAIVSSPGIPDYPYRMQARQMGMTIWDELRTRPEPD